MPPVETTDSCNDSVMAPRRPDRGLDRVTSRRAGLCAPIDGKHACITDNPDLKGINLA
jgi:hypothetical protein